MLFDYLECWFNNHYYNSPLSLDGLAIAARTAVYLDSGLKFKRNLLVRTFTPHKLLSRGAFEQFALDWLWSGNAYRKRRHSRLGTPISLQPPLAKYMRREEEGRFFHIRGGGTNRNSPRVLSAACARPTSTERSMACWSGSRPCSRRSSTSRPPCSGASTAAMAVTPASSST